MKLMKLEFKIRIDEIEERINIVRNHPFLSSKDKRHIIGKYNQIVEGYKQLIKVA